MTSYDAELETLATNIERSGDTDTAQALRSLAALRRLDSHDPDLYATRTLAEHNRQLEQDFRQKTKNRRLCLSQVHSEYACL